MHMKYDMVLIFWNTKIAKLRLSCLEDIQHSLGPSSVDVSWPKDLVPQDDTRQAGRRAGPHTLNTSLVRIYASTLYQQGGWGEFK